MPSTAARRPCGKRRRGACSQRGSGLILGACAPVLWTSAPPAKSTKPTTKPSWRPSARHPDRAVRARRYVPSSSVT